MLDKLNTKVFLHVVESKNFKHTAETLGYTQAGVSYIINAMEDELGIRLFHREYGGVRLTTEGEILLPYIRQIEDSYRVLDEKRNELQGLETGTIKIQVFDSISIHWIPDILKIFHKDFPGIRVELVTVEDSQLAEKMVYRQEVDCGFFPHTVTSDIEVTPLIRESLKAVVSFEHPLANKTIFPLSKLGDYPYIQMTYDENTGISHIFESRGIKPNIAFRMDNDYSAMAMVSKNHGFCIFPELLLQDMPYQMKCLDFDEPISRTISIGIRSTETASKAVLKFVEYTKNWVAKNAHATIL